MPGRFHVASEIGSAWWRGLSSIGMTPERFHGLPGWQQRLGKLAVAGVIAFLIAILVNVLEASFGSTGSTPRSSPSTAPRTSRSWSSA